MSALPNERARDRAQTAAILAGVAPLMPRGWRAVPPTEDREHGYLVRAADGARIHVRAGGWRNEGRVAFRGVSPMYADGTPHYGGKSLAITVRADRAPKAMAGEIARRLLPAYDAAYAKELAYVRMRDDGGAEAAVVGRRIAAALGAEVVEPQHRRAADGVHLRRVPERVARVIVRPAYQSETWSHPCVVDFEVHHLDPETALEVLEIIRAAQERGGARVAARVAEPRDEETVAEEAEAPAAQRRIA